MPLPSPATLRPLAVFCPAGCPFKLRGKARAALSGASPVTLQARNATRDVELGGQVIARGDVVALSFPSANRDEDAFPGAERCILDRSPNWHVAFGFGPHLCAGAHIARLELTVALEELVARVDELRLAAGSSPRWNPTGSVRSLATLPVSMVHRRRFEEPAPTSSA